MKLKGHTDNVKSLLLNRDGTQVRMALKNLILSLTFKNVSHWYSFVEALFFI